MSDSLLLAWWGSGYRARELTTALRALGHEPPPVTCPGCDATQTIVQPDQVIWSEHREGCAWVAGWAAHRAGESVEGVPGICGRPVTAE